MVPGHLKGTPGTLPKVSAVRLVVALVAVLAFPSSAAAALPSIVARDVPLHASARSLAAAPSTFNLVGLHWQGPGTVEFRTRTVSGRWSGWRPAAPEDEDRPDRFALGAVAPGLAAREPVLDGRVEPARGAHARAASRACAPGTSGARSTGEPSADARAGGRAGDRDADAVEGQRADPPCGPLVRHLAVVRRRPPHRRRQHVHARAVGGDRPRDPDVPRAGERLERPGLQLPRRQVRPGVRGPVRRASSGTSSARTRRGSTPARSAWR